MWRQARVNANALALLILAFCTVTIGQDGQWVEPPWSNAAVAKDIGDVDPLQRLFPPLPLNRYAFIPVVWTATGLSSDPDYNQMMEWIDDVFEKAAVPGEQQEAITWMRDIVASYSQFRVARSYLAVVLLQCGTKQDRSEAEDIFKEELEHNNWNWMGHNNLGVLLEMRGAADDALESYLIATEAIEESCFAFSRCAYSAALVFFNAGRLLRARELSEGGEKAGGGGGGEEAHRAFAAAARLHSSEPLSAPFLFYTSQALRARATSSSSSSYSSSSAPHSETHSTAALARASRRALLRAMGQPGFNFDAPREQLVAEDAAVLRQRRFDSIFHTKFWHPESESASGPGSNVDMTAPTRTLVEGLVSELGVTSVLDVGCGDLMWMKWMDWRGVDYTGVDIAEGVIERNKQAMAELRRECAANQRQNKPDEHTTDEDEDETTRRCERLPRTDVFGAVDVVRGFPARLCGLRSEEEEEEDANAPSSSATRRAEEEERVHVRARGEEGGCELVVLKEVLIHLTVEDILRALVNLHSAALETRGQARAPRYLLVTHDEAVTRNDDISVTLFPLPGGGWRPINLLLPPFSLPPPLRVFPDTGFGFSLWTLPFGSEESE